MNKIETAGVIIGFIGIMLEATRDRSLTNCSWKDILVASIINVCRLVIFGAMILLPMYFNFWRNK